MKNESSDTALIHISNETLAEYLSSVYGREAIVKCVWRLGAEKGKTKDLKGFGYGFPCVIEFAFEGETKRVVLETMRSEGFGHDHFSDRAQILLWQHDTFNKLPGHARSIDVGAFTKPAQGLKSLGDCREFFLLTEFIEGNLYHIDLDRLKEGNALTELDRLRCLALSDYLAEIHSVKRDAPWLYTRRIRELVGHGECIMGLLDSYPPQLQFTSESFLADIERDSVIWRWTLKKKTQRLSQVHGDFHPWNIIFKEGTNFTVLDRSRGEFGEPADDLAAMTINYLFYSLQKYGELKTEYRELFDTFWENYLQKTRDEEILEVIQPFFAWRGLVVASPIWYPDLTLEVRTKLLNFVKNVMQTHKLDLKRVNTYFRKP